MFGLSKKITPSSLISSNTSVKGSIKSDGEVYIDGSFEGDIIATTIIVGINGKIKSQSVTTEKIVVYGYVEGNINAMSVFLGASSRINGNIIHRDISIENGAYISGDLKQKRD